MKIELINSWSQYENGSARTSNLSLFFPFFKAPLNCVNRWGQHWRRRFPISLSHGRHSLRSEQKA